MSYSDEIKKNIRIAQEKKVQAEKPSAVQDKSALNTGERLAWGAIGESPKAKQEFLEQRYNKKDIVRPEDSPTGDWGVKSKSGHFFPVDPKGFKISDLASDIAESAPSTIQGTLTGLAQGVGALAGGVGEAVTGSAVNTALEYGKQKLARQLTGLKSDIDNKEIMTATATGAIPFGSILKLGKPALTAVAKKSLTPLAEGVVETMLPKTIRTLAQDTKNAVIEGKGVQGVKDAFKSAKEALKPSTIEKIAENPQKQSVIKQMAKTPEEIESIAKQTAKDFERTDNTMRFIDHYKGQLDDGTIEAIAKNKSVRKELINKGADNMVKDFDQRAQEAANGLVDLEKNFQGIKKDIYKDAGIDFQKTKVNVNSAIDNMENALKNKMESISVTPTVKKQLQEAVDYISEIRNATVKNNGNVSFGEILDIEKELRNSAKKAFNAGDNSIGSIYSDLSKQINEAKNSIPEIKLASKDFSNVIKLQDTLEDVFKLDSTKGELSLAKKLQGARLVNDQGDDLLENINKAIRENPRLQKYSGVIDKIKIAQVGADLKKAKEAKPVGWVNRMPVLKQISELPIWNDRQRMQRFAKGIESGRIDPNKVLSARFQSSANPFIGPAINKIRALSSADMLKIPALPNIPQSQIEKIAQLQQNVKKVLPIAQSTYMRQTIQNIMNNNNIKQEDKQPMIDYQSKFAPKVVNGKTIHGIL